MKHRDAGYTMIELAVAVSIVGIITALAIAHVVPASAERKDATIIMRDWEQAACRFNQNVAQNATEYYCFFYGNYPDSPEVLTPSLLDRVPACPVNKKPYHYNQHHLIVCPSHPR